MRKMFNKQTFERIIEKNKSNEFCSGSYHLYIYWGEKDSETSLFEEEHLILTPLDGVLEIQDLSDDDCVPVTYIPYEEIYEVSITPDF